MAASKVLGVPATNKLARKIEEIRLSFWLEREMERRFGSKRRAKEEILARYASFIYMGNGRYGFSAASEYYFAKPLSSYGPGDADKAALLAGITKSPRDYAPAPGNVERAARRRNDILGLMARNGSLPAEMARRAQAAPVRLAARSKIKTEAPAVVENVFTELKAARREGVSVEALIDGRISVQHDRGQPHPAPRQRGPGVGPARLRDAPSQEPRASSRARWSCCATPTRPCWRRRADARSTRTATPRTATTTGSRTRAASPGSVMKPIVYLAAFRHGEALDDPVADEPISVSTGLNTPPKWIQNYDAKFKGLIPVRQALAESRNAATIRLAQGVGMREILRTARELGIRTPLQPYITTALGASEVQLLELANAYRALASNVSAEPHVIARVSDGPRATALFVADRPCGRWPSTPRRCRHPGRAARRGAAAQRHRARAGRRRLRDPRDGEDGHEQRLP